MFDLVVDLAVRIAVQVAQLRSDERPALEDSTVDHVSPRAANAPAALDQALGVQVGENLLLHFQWQDCRTVVPTDCTSIAKWT